MHQRLISPQQHTEALKVYLHSRVYAAAIIFSRLNRLTRSVLSVLSTPHINLILYKLILNGLIFQMDIMNYFSPTFSNL